MASFSAQDAINKSSMSEDVRVAGESVGIDVDKLRKKYLTQKLTANLAAGGSEDQLKVKQQLDDAARMRAMESEAGCGSGSESSKDDKKMVRPGSPKGLRTVKSKRSDVNPLVNPLSLLPGGD